MDVLADVFAALRVGGMIYAQSDLRAPWAMAFDRSDKAGFHVVVRGSCWLRVAREEPRELHQGDVVLLPRGWTHSIADTATRRSCPFQETLARQAAASGPGTATSARIICGAYALAPEAERSLLELVPPIVHIPAERASEELRATVAILSREAGSSDAGSTAAAARLVDLLLIFVLRAWIADQPEGAGGWLGALRDPGIARVLAQLHADPSAPWELEALARAAGLSRATLARRFRDLVGMPPLTYLTRWRMTLAGRRLRETSESLATIAAGIGYDSEFAFNRAFKREVGRAPGDYRKRAASLPG